jgi:hypothetical protein
MKFSKPYLAENKTAADKEFVVFFICLNFAHPRKTQCKNLCLTV